MQHVHGEGTLDELRRWVAAAQAGDDDAFRRVYGRMSERVRARAFRVTGDRHEAEDVVQETFLVVHRRLRDLRETRAFVGWVLRIAHNVAVDRARRLGRCRPSLRAHDEDADRAEDLPRVVSRWGAGEPSPGSRALFLEEYGRLTDSVRETVRLRYAVGLSCAEIGRVQGLGHSCIKTRLHRARKRLGAALLA